LCRSASRQPSRVCQQRTLPQRGVPHSCEVLGAQLKQSHRRQVRSPRSGAREPLLVQATRLVMASGVACMLTESMSLAKQRRQLRSTRSPRRTARSTRQGPNASPVSLLLPAAGALVYSALGSSDQSDSWSALTLPTRKDKEECTTTSTQQECPDVYSTKDFTPLVA
jgi:hypothetical protein